MRTFGNKPATASPSQGDHASTARHTAPSTSSTDVGTSSARSLAGAAVDRPAQTSIRARDFADVPVHAGKSEDSFVGEAGVRRTLQGAGRPLDRAIRRFFEPRFSRDFSHVRVHDGAEAQASTRTLGTSAYTVGRHLVLGHGIGSPASARGHQLYAHELAHLAQQQAVAGTQGIERIGRSDGRAEQEADAAATALGQGRSPLGLTPATQLGLQCAPPKAPAPEPVFYQELVDALAEERRINSRYRIQIYPSAEPSLERLIAVCEAIDRGSAEDARTAFVDFIDGDKEHLPYGKPTTGLVGEIGARLLMLGLDAEAGRLRTWVVSREKSLSPPISGPYSYDIYAWEHLEEALLERIPETGGAQALPVLDGLLLLMGMLLNERFSLNEDEIAKDRKKRRDLYDNPFVQNDKSIAVYAGRLEEMVKEVFKGVQSAFQVVLDQAVEDLVAKRGSAMLDNAKDRLEKKLRPLIEPADKARYIGGATVETTVSDFQEKGGKHLDAVAPNEAARKKRTVNVNYYDAEQILALTSEMSGSFREIFLSRRDQIALIERIYGLEKDERGVLTAETTENAAAIGKLGAGGMKLHSDDDWRRFAIEKFELHAAKEGDEKAMVAVIDLLAQYMRVFTVHTPYNIEDFGDNLLTKSFPRDLAGRLIHDCGVYALRVAYILSLMRDHPRLQLRFRYTVMPLHVGLLITGANLPTYLVNNDSFIRYDVADRTTLETEWQTLDETGQKGTPKKPATEARFTGELMADAFIHGVDLPYIQYDVVKTSKTPATAKSALWQQYSGTVAPTADKLFGPSVKDPKSPNYQCYLQYLKLLDLTRKHHNESLVKFWNVTASELWNKHKRAIVDADAAIRKAKPDERVAAQAAYDAAVKAYADPLQAALDTVRKDADPIIVAQAEIQAYLAAHPEVFGAGSEIASADRIETMLATFGFGGAWWESQIFRHVLALQGRTSFEAPFEKPDQKLTPMH